MEVISGILWLIVILSVLVVAHEFGHFIAARLCKMRVEEFSLFFGPVIFKLGKHGDTEYNIRSVPVGGFVKIAGMEADDISGGRPILEALKTPPGSGQSLEELIKQLNVDTMAELDVSKVSAGIHELLQQAINVDGHLSDQGRQDIQDKLKSPLLSHDEHKLLSMALNADIRTTDAGLYSSKPLWQRAIVIFAGPFASLMFGYILFCLMGITIGLPSLTRSTNQVLVMPDGVARAAGMRTGDRIVAINNVKTPTGEELKKIIHAMPEKWVVLLLERDGKMLPPLRVKPKKNYFPIYKDGKQVIGSDHKPVMEPVGLIGVMPNPIMERQGVIDSIVSGTDSTYTTIRMMLTSIFSKHAKDNVGGPIAMGQMTIAMQKLGIARLIEMAGMFSLSLGVMNLLPIPILDGGHLLLLAIEGLRRRKLSPLEVYRAQMVGLGILGLMMCLVIYNDLVRTLGGKGFQ